MDIITDIQQLHKPARPVEVTDRGRLRSVAATLFTEMKAHNAQGLSANQLGIDMKVFVMKHKTLYQVCIANPEIISRKGKQKSSELCLSLPGTTVDVMRPMGIRVKGVNQYFNPVNYALTGIDARRACHEIDHLNGRLITYYVQEFPVSKSETILERVRRLKEQQERG